MTIAATSAKLKTGDWGARVVGTAKPGDVLTITGASGKSWDASVERVVWTDGKVSLCATYTTTQSTCKASFVVPSSAIPRGIRGWIRGTHDEFVDWLSRNATNRTKLEAVAASLNYDLRKATARDRIEAVNHGEPMPRWTLTYLGDLWTDPVKRCETLADVVTELDHISSWISHYYSKEG